MKEPNEITNGEVVIKVDKSSFVKALIKGEKGCFCKSDFETKLTPEEDIIIGGMTEEDGKIAIVYCCRNMTRVDVQDPVFEKLGNSHWIKAHKTEFYEKDMGDCKPRDGRVTHNIEFKDCKSNREVTDWKVGFCLGSNNDGGIRVKGIQNYELNA